MKVFVLAIEWAIDYESDHKVAVFATHELAHDEMVRDYENFCSEFDEFDIREINEDAAWCYLDGEYSSNHCAWQIHEEEVVTE